MNYKFELTLAGRSDFRCEIAIDSDQTFQQLNDLIVKTMKFDAANMASFFALDDDGCRKREIAAMDMGEFGEQTGEPVLVMDQTRIRDVVNANCMELEYVYDMISGDAFRMEYAGGYSGDDEEMPVCLSLEGRVPSQTNFALMFGGRKPKTDSDDYGEPAAWRGEERKREWDMDQDSDIFGTERDNDYSGSVDFDDYDDEGGGRSGYRNIYRDYGDDADDEFGGADDRFENLDDYIDKL